MKEREIVKDCGLCLDVGLECHEYLLKTRVILFKGVYAGVKINSPIKGCSVRKEIIQTKTVDRKVRPIPKVD